MRCDLCFSDAKTCNRAGGLNVCDACFLGGGVKAAKVRGWQLEVRTWTSFVDRRNIEHHCLVTAHLSARDDELELQAIFRPRRGWNVPLGWFIGLKVADPLFTKAVIATSKQPALLRGFLESDGAQSAVMDLVTEPCRIDVQGAVVQSHARLMNQSPDEARVQAETAILLAHLERFREGRAGKG